MKWRRAAFIGLAPMVGCGEPSMPAPLDPAQLTWTDKSGYDSRQTTSWRMYLEASKLNAAWCPPPSSPWFAYHKNALIAAINMVRPTAGPISGKAETEAEQLADSFVTNATLAGSAVFVDLPGPESVAWGAILARRGGVPICTFNNWPHQSGLLKHERTLGALLYYAAELNGLPKSGNTPVFMLEANRLTRKTYVPRADEFDNRYFHLVSDFPSPETLQSLGIRTIYYVVRAAQEEDDLNAYFVRLKSAGMQFTLVNPSRFIPTDPRFMSASWTPSERDTIFDRNTTSSYASTTRTTYHRSYYHYQSFWYSSQPSFGGGGGGSVSS